MCRSCTWRRRRTTAGRPHTRTPVSAHRRCGRSWCTGMRDLRMLCCVREEVTSSLSFELLMHVAFFTAQTASGQLAASKVSQVRFASQCDESNQIIQKPHTRGTHAEALLPHAASALQARLRLRENIAVCLQELRIDRRESRGYPMCRGPQKVYIRTPGSWHRHLRQRTSGSLHHSRSGDSLQTHPRRVSELRSQPSVFATHRPVLMTVSSQTVLGHFLKPPSENTEHPGAVGWAVAVMGYDMQHESTYRDRMLCAESPLRGRQGDTSALGEATSEP